MAHAASPYLRSLGRLLLLVAGWLGWGGVEGSAQLLEFESSRTRGRLDNPTSSELWIIGDANGNGILDETEESGPIVEINGAMHPESGYSSLTPEPVGQGDFDIGRQSDFGDIVLLPAAFQSLNASVFARSSGVQMMRVLRFAPLRESDKSQNVEALELAYGARFYGLGSYTQISATGGVLGNLSADSDVENEGVGPQVAATWTRRRGRWESKAEGAISYNYLSAESTLSGQMGESLVAGQYNRPLFFQPSRFQSADSQWDYAPAAEVGVRLSYDLAPWTVCFIRCDAIFFGNLRDAKDSIVWQLPTPGLADAAPYDATVTFGSIGLEWRR